MTQPPLRVAIYARFSTDKQRDASIEDQVDSCRELAAREGWEVVATYHDRATSGASMFRPGIEALQRRPVSPVVQDWAFRSGLLLLLTMMLFVTFNDLGSFGLWKSLSGLIG